MLQILQLLRDVDLKISFTSTYFFQVKYNFILIINRRTTVNSFILCVAGIAFLKVI